MSFIQHVLVLLRPWGCRVCAFALCGVLNANGGTIPSDTDVTVERARMRDALSAQMQNGAVQRHLDLNGDGHVNILDVVLLRLHETRREVKGTKALVNQAPRALGGERIVVEPVSVTTIAGNQVAVLFLLRGNTAPLLGYTLDVQPLALTGAVGTVSPGFSETNFFDSRNIIAAGGAVRDPFFSVIQDNGSGGVSVTTLTDDLSTVLAVDGSNDVFAEVVFDVAPNTHGEFLLTLGPTTAISDESGSPVPFTFVPGTIEVTAEAPAVSAWGILIFGLMLMVTAAFVFEREKSVKLVGVLVSR